MRYKYTEFNRLENPHKYMYTPYQGEDFIDSYFRDRLANIKQLQSGANQPCRNKVDQYLCLGAIAQLDGFLNKKLSDQVKNNWKTILNSKGSYCFAGGVKNIICNTEKLSSFNIEDKISSEKLLTTLLFNQLNNKSNELVKIWLDRLVQRFEVTKKLYETYPVGFRKGRGRSDLVRLYWLFGLSLTLFYSATSSIKYLSTQLKVSDLLCSLDENYLKEELPSKGLFLILLVELLNIQSLSNNINEVDFDFA